MKKSGLHPHSGKQRAEIKNNAGGASCESCRQQDGTISLWNPKDIEGRADCNEARHDRFVRSATRKPNRKRQLKFICVNMTATWDQHGKRHPLTILHVGSNHVVQVERPDGKVEKDVILKDFDVAYEEALTDRFRLDQAP